ncbi:MAG: hypothetical protein ACW964_02015 [Candidatus Hodarchaeales archaeon]|jgi:hypothetical protein
MNKSIESVEQYLNEVNIHLGNLADRDQIITELRAHIWDLANKLSIDKGLSVQESFDHAILRMEDPQILASKFFDEEPNNTKIEWKAPLTTPESKLNNEQFLLIAIIGVVGIALIALLTTVSSRISYINPYITIGVSFAFGFLVICMFVVALYFYDARLFREQLGKLRETFLRPLEERRTHKKANSKLSSFESRKQITPRAPSSWGAFGEHLGGFLGGFFIGIIAILFFAIDITNAIPLFNKNWFTIGFIVFYVGLGAGFVEALFKLIFGRIRATRLVSASTNILAGICNIFLIIYYPFTFELALNSFSSSSVNVIIGIPGVIDADSVVIIIIGIIAIIQFLNALYDVFKFGAWKPSDRKSLI